MTPSDWLSFREVSPGCRRSPANLSRCVLLASVAFLVSGGSLVLTGCRAPVGAHQASAARVYHQLNQNALNGARPGPDTLFALERFDQVGQFAQDPDVTLRLIHGKAVATGDRNLLFVLSELNCLAGDRLGKSQNAGETRDPRDYYLASAVYAWFFLFGDAAGAPPGAFDQRFRISCDLYNYSLGCALAERHDANTMAVLEAGWRQLPLAGMQLRVDTTGFPWPLEYFDRFVLCQRLLVRGLSVRNRQSGLGAPLVAVARPEAGTELFRCAPATVILRVKGTLADLDRGAGAGSLELYSGYNDATVHVGSQAVPLETDTTAPQAYALNQSLLWRLGRLQFLSFKERIPSGIYLSQPYEPGKVPVVFVHGTFSCPVWWAEMINTLSADPELRKKCQFWWFIYNSGNPSGYSAVALREALIEKLQTLDPDAKDAALRQMVVIGHSQGGLLAKLTATDTGEKLIQAVFKTNQLESLDLSSEQQAILRRYATFEALPFVKRVVFISTPHRGSYRARGFVRRVARRLVSLPSRIIEYSKDFAGISSKAALPRELRGAPTSLDAMSPTNPVWLTLADIPLAPGIKGHSIISVKGKGDYHHGRDGLVSYASAHVDYVESEFIVRGPHSCQAMPAAIEEVRRILHEHLSARSD